MAYTTSIRAFGRLALRDALVDSYRMLVALELALKDAKCFNGGSGHDVPSMLTVAAYLPATLNFPYVGAQLLGYSATLKSDLVAIYCQGKDGKPTTVPWHNYPYIRYTRRPGDWGGVAETPTRSIVSQATAVSCCRTST
jgi:hypothetical protein